MHKISFSLQFNWSLLPCTVGRSFTYGKAKDNHDKFLDYKTNYIVKVSIK